MPRVTYIKICLDNLEGKIPETDPMFYASKEVAYEALKDWTGQDFGYDADAWRQWFR